MSMNDLVNAEQKFNELHRLYTTDTTSLTDSTLYQEFRKTLLEQQWVPSAPLVTPVSVIPAEVEELKQDVAKLKAIAKDMTAVVVQLHQTIKDLYALHEKIFKDVHEMIVDINARKAELDQYRESFRRVKNTERSADT